MVRLGRLDQLGLLVQLGLLGHLGLVDLLGLLGLLVLLDLLGLVILLYVDMVERLVRKVLEHDGNLQNCLACRSHCHLVWILGDLTRRGFVVSGKKEVQD